MGKLKIICAAAMAMACTIVSAEAPISVNLNISRPTESVSKTGEDHPKHLKHGTGTATEVKTTTFEYSGKVGCNLPKDKTATVTLEAYFITREIGKKGAHDELSRRQEIDKYEFGGENPNQYKFSLTSPSIAQTTVTTVKQSRNRGRRRGGGGSSMKKDKTGTRLMGVIVRAMVDGKPVKVISEPNNSKWIAAGKNDVISLE